MKDSPALFSSLSHPGISSPIARQLIHQLEVRKRFLIGIKKTDPCLMESEKIYGRKSM
jgi:hypothetical protein